MYVGLLGHIYLNLQALVFTYCTALPSAHTHPGMWDYGYKDKKTKEIQPDKRILW